MTVSDAIAALRSGMVLGERAVAYDFTVPSVVRQTAGAALRDVTGAIGFGGDACAAPPTRTMLIRNAKIRDRQMAHDVRLTLIGGSIIHAGVD